MDYQKIAFDAASSLSLLDARGVMLPIDSIQLIELITTVEAAVGLQLPKDELRPEVFASLDSIAAMLRRVSPP